MKTEEILRWLLAVAVSSFIAAFAVNTYIENKIETEVDILWQEIAQQLKGAVFQDSRINLETAGYRNYYIGVSDGIGPVDTGPQANPRTNGGPAETFIIHKKMDQ